MIIDVEKYSVKVLDHGFVRLVDCMPRVIPSGYEKLRCDYAIAEAARVSYGGGSKGEEADGKLIRYLLRNKHTSPFEMVKFKFHLKLPIFVQRQLIRHRTANVNEISGRYTQLKDEFYVPLEPRKQSSNNKQGSEDWENGVPDELMETYNEYMDKNSEVYSLYNKLVESNMAKEVARICLPQNIYTELYWCMDLHNLLHFVKLRASNHAQAEIREYAFAIDAILRDLCPVTMRAFEDFIEDSVSFSTTELRLVNRYLSGDTDLSKQFHNKREYQEFVEKMERIK